MPRWWWWCWKWSFKYQVLRTGKVIQKAFLFLSSKKYDIWRAHWCDFSHMEGKWRQSEFSLFTDLKSSPLKIKCIHMKMGVLYQPISDCEGFFFLSLLAEGVQTINCNLCVCLWKWTISVVQNKSLRCLLSESGMLSMLSHCYAIKANDTGSWNAELFSITFLEIQCNLLYCISSNFS